MEMLTEIVTGVLDVGAVVMLPIVMTILGLIFRVKFDQALKAGVTIGIGFAGLQVMVSFLLTSVQPAIDFYSSMNGSGFTTVDIGWAAVDGAAWSVPWAPLVIIFGILINLALIFLNVVDVLNIDIWNYAHFLVAGTMAWALSGNLWLGFGVAMAFCVIDLFLAQAVAPKWQEYTGVPGITCSTLCQLSFGWPFAELMNKIIDAIPVVRDIDWSMDKVGEKLGVLGDPAIIGLIVGLILGVLTQQPWQSTLLMGMQVAASLVLLPKMVSIMMEGLSTIAGAAQEFMRKHVGKDKDGNERELLVGMDVALGIGNPAVVTTSVIMIPLAILFAFIIPGMTYFPIGTMTGIIYQIAMFAMVSRGNLFRTVVSFGIFQFVTEWLAAIVAPEATAMLVAAGMSVSGLVTDAFFGLSGANLLVAFVGRLFTGI